MDDTAQKPNQTNDDVQVQVQPQVPVPSQPQPQVTPVGTTNKEVEVAPVSEFVKPSEIAAIKDKEVAEAGIVEAEREIELEETHKEMGIKPEPAPVITEPKKVNAQSLMTPEEIKADLRKTGVFNITGHYLGIYIANSRDFLAALLNKILRKPTNQPA